MTKDEFLARAAKLFNGEIQTLSDEDLREIVCLTQYCADVALQEWSERGLMETVQGYPLVPADLPEGIEPPVNPLVA